MNQQQSQQPAFFNVDVELKWYAQERATDDHKDTNRQIRERYQKHIDKIRENKSYKTQTRQS